MKIVLAGERLELGRDDARALLDHLWKGLRPGAVTAAGKLGRALEHRSSVEFDPSELDAVRDALGALGLS